MRNSTRTALSFMAGVAVAEIARELAPRAPKALQRRRTPARADQGASSANLEQAAQSGRGHEARSPQEIPARGWKDIALRTWAEFNADQIPMIAAGVTFYTLLALFPGIGAFASLYGLFADVADAQRHIQAMSAILPGGAISLIGDQMIRVAQAGGGGLSLTFIVSFLLALWSANGAMKAVITGLNIAYEETETRGLIGKVGVPLAFTVGFLLLALIASGLAAIGAYIPEHWGETAGWIFNAIYWPSLLVAFGVGLALLYRFGPSRRHAKWRWVSWGSIAAAMAWLTMSAGFSFYVANFGSYDRTYGSLGAVIGFMTWTWLSSMVVLLGAELNSEIEHQTARDSTVGPERPLGARGAEMADTIGTSQDASPHAPKLTLLRFMRRGA